MTTVSQVVQEVWRESRLELSATIKTAGNASAAYALAAVAPAVLAACGLWVASFLGAWGALALTVAVLALAALAFLVGSGSPFSPIAKVAAPFAAVELRQRHRSLCILKERIDLYSRREFDWDGSGGHAPSATAVTDAKNFLAQLPSTLAIPDQVYAPGDGEVMFQWRRPTAFVEVGFYGDGTISWLARRGSGEPSYGDDPFQREKMCLPDKLLAALRSLGRG
jgi:hypothetical protein